MILFCTFLESLTGKLYNVSFKHILTNLKIPILSKRNNYDIKATRLRRKGNTITT